MYYAHSLSGMDQSQWQPLLQHLEQSAALAKRFAEPFGAGRAAALAALLHDLGKYNPKFQQRLSGDPARVEHALAGAAVVAEMGQGVDVFLTRILAYAIAGHHAGLPDFIGDYALMQRLGDYQGEELDSCWREELGPALDALELKAGGLLPFKPQREQGGFQLALLGRMLFSCLVDADYKDTEAFYARHEGWTAERQWPQLQDLISEFCTRYQQHMAGLAQAAAERQSNDGAMVQLNQRRAEILQHVRDRSSLKPGLFTLNVPTGGGKTLASLGFALDHARHHGMNRIIYAIPFTSIIDQTASIFREVLGEEWVLEHHCAVEMSQQDQARGDGRSDASRSDEGRRQAKSKLALAMEDWAAPVVVTTNVQLFESLFAARSSRCRKLHHLVGAVIILDEAQTLPRRLLAPVVQVLRELCLNYGCSIVLCTATQPALEKEKFANPDLAALLGLELAGRELAPDPAALAREFRRARIEHVGALSDEQLLEQLAQVDQGLVIVNSRRHARELYEQAHSQELAGLFHLSTRQYAQHRRELLAHIRTTLQAGQPCRVIATSLVEAGVDVDFPQVWRAQAGLEQIIQAAGRCNREGKRPLDQSLVRVFESERPAPREVMLQWRDWQRVQGKAGLDDPLTLEAIEAYFGEVYWRLSEAGVDEEKILADFYLNRFDHWPTFAYRTVAEKFRMIENGLEAVIIPRDEECSEQLRLLEAGVPTVGAIARRLQPYLVQIPPQDRNRLIARGHVQAVRSDLYGSQFQVLRSPGLYHPALGLLWEDSDSLGLVSAVI